MYLKCILLVIYHHLFQNFWGQGCYLRKFVKNPSFILLVMRYYFLKGIQGCQPGEFLEYFRHLSVFYRLFTIFCFVTLEIQGITPENVVKSFLHFSVIYPLFDTFWKVAKRYHLWKLFTIFHAFLCILSVIYHRLFGNGVRYLILFGKWSRGVIFGHLLASFMHFCVFYQLFIIVCLGKGSGV